MEQKKYILTLEINGEKTVSEGATLDEAIENLKAPEKYGTKGVFTMEYDGKISKPIFLFVTQMKKLFGERIGLGYEAQRDVLIKKLMAMYS